MKTKEERRELFEQREAVRKAKLAEANAQYRERMDAINAKAAEDKAAWKARRGPSLGDRLGYRAKLAGGAGSAWQASLAWVLPYGALTDRVPLGYWEGTPKP